MPSWQWSDTWLYEFSMMINGMALNQEIVWFLSQQMTTEQVMNLSDFIKRIDTGTGLTQYIWTNRTDVRMSKIASKRTAMALVFTTGATDPVMFMHNRIMTGRHFGMSMVVYAPKVTSLEPIEKLCHVMYNGSFVNSIIYFQTADGYNQLYGYEQYPDFMLENRTDYTAFIKRQYKKIMAATQDVGGYKFYTPLRQDLPQVFKYQDRYGRQQVQGTTYLILESFVESLNGTLVEYPMKSDGFGGDAVNMKDVLELVRSRKIDMSAHAYALFRSDDELDKSYPIMVVKLCLMVPMRNSISTFLYPLQPFEWKVWIILACALLALCIIDFFHYLWLTTKAKTRYNLFFLLTKAWLDDFCYVLNVAATKVIRVTSWVSFILYACIFFFGFFLSANYTSYLGSFLTVSLFRAQINSIDDIIKAQLPVMVIDYELEFLLDEGYVMPSNFQKLLRPVDPSTFDRHQLNFNTSYAYFITDEKWHFLDESQKHLKQRVFQFSDICFGSYHLAYPMQTDSAVWRDMEYFLFATHSTGILEKYEKASFQYALSAGFVKRLADSKDYISAGFEHLSLVFYILAVMYLLAGLCLLCEIFIYKFIKGKINRK